MFVFESKTSAEVDYYYLGKKMQKNCFHVFLTPSFLADLYSGVQANSCRFYFLADLELFYNFRKNGYLFTEKLSKAKSVLIC